MKQRQGVDRYYVDSLWLMFTKHQAHMRMINRIFDSECKTGTTLTNVLYGYKYQVPVPVLQPFNRIHGVSSCQSISECTLNV